MKAHTVDETFHTTTRAGSIRIAAGVGALAAAGCLGVRIALVGEHPGTSSYVALNRSWLPALIVLSIGVAGLSWTTRKLLSPLGYAGGLTALCGAIAAAAGNAVEFQLGQSRGFILFGLGFILFAAGMVGYGAGLRGEVSRLVKLAAQGTGIFGFLTSIAGVIGVVSGVLFVAAWVAIGAKPLRTPHAGEMR